MHISSLIIPIIWICLLALCVAWALIMHWEAKFWRSQWSILEKDLARAEKRPARTIKEFLTFKRWEG